MKSDVNLLRSWQYNATAWVDALANDRIVSRKAASNDAILQAVQSHAPRTIIDLGCGEGWLCRALQTHGIVTTGIDGVRELIDVARQSGPGTYIEASYNAIRQGVLDGLEPADLVVSNFALFEADPLKALLRRVRKWLLPHGQLVIQTIHPQHPAFAQRTEPGWVTEDWQWLDASLGQSFDWYFRTIDSWEMVLTAAGFQSTRPRTVYWPEKTTALSLILEAHPER